MSKEYANLFRNEAYKGKKTTSESKDPEAQYANQNNSSIYETTKKDGYAGKIPFEKEEEEQQNEYKNGNGWPQNPSDMKEEQSETDPWADFDDPYENKEPEYKTPSDRIAEQEEEEYRKEEYKKQKK